MASGNLLRSEVRRRNALGDGGDHDHDIDEDRDNGDDSDDGDNDDDGDNVDDNGDVDCYIDDDGSS